MKSNDSNKFIEHVFRHEYGKIVAILLSKFGPTNLEKIEDAVQDSLIKAMQIWAYKGRPQKPTAWLLKASNNNLIDTLRRDNKNILQDNIFVFEGSESTINIEALDHQINDSQLRMIFACCNPKLSVTNQLILSLKLIGGFSNKEISYALLKKEESIAKAYTRAKKSFKETIKTLDIPIEMGLASRVQSVLKVIYLMYSEGYRATTGKFILKKDFCFEAIRLALLLVEHKSTKVNDVHALIALMCFHTARFDARVNEHGILVDLEHQDRSKYDTALVAFGIQHLEIASHKNESTSQYYYQAIIAYHYSSASDFASINWKRILEVYQVQLRFYYSPIIELNSLVPFYKINGAKMALVALGEYAQKPMSIKNSLYYSIQGELYKSLGEKKKASMAINRAIELSENDMEKNHLISKLSML